MMGELHKLALRNLYYAVKCFHLRIQQGEITGKKNFEAKLLKISQIFKYSNIL